MRQSSVPVLTGPMPVTGYRFAITAAVSALVLLGVPGCGSADATPGPATAAAASASPPASQRYASKAFVLPLAVTVDAPLKSPPQFDSPSLPPAVRTVVTGGMAGWQITLIAAGVALIAATLAVLLDRARAARRQMTAPTA